MDMADKRKERVEKVNSLLRECVARKLPLKFMELVLLHAPLGQYKGYTQTWVLRCYGAPYEKKGVQLAWVEYYDSGGNPACAMTFTDALQIANAQVLVQWETLGFPAWRFDDDAGEVKHG